MNFISTNYLPMIFAGLFAAILLMLIFWRKYRWKGFTFEKGVGKNNAPTYVVKKEGKTQITVPVDLINSSRDEIENWYEYLNMILGATSLGFALASQGTPNPPLNAFICLMFILILHFGINFGKFPSHLRSLRNENRIAYRFLASKIEGMELNPWKAVTMAPLFLIGYIYLLLLVLMALSFVQDISIMDHKLADIFLPKDCVCRFKAG